jgi:O-antigen/teichoic acid export membrane protein
VNWAKDIFAVQWRAAISYIGSYFSFSFITPVLFQFHGAEVAGQFGLSMSIFGAFSSVAVMWSTTRGPQFAIMIARKEYNQLDSLHSKLMKINFIILMLGGCAGWLVVYGINLFEYPFASRLIGPLPMALLIAGIIVGNSLHPTTIYLRAHKREPYALLNAVDAVVSGLLSLLLGMKYAVMGAASSFVIMSAVMFPWRLSLFTRYRVKWRQ